MCRASCNILYYNYIYHRTVGTNYLPVHYNRGSTLSNWTNDRHGDCTMESCHINFMYVNSGIDKSLDVSISLTKQIPHKVQTEGLLCSYYPSGTAADRVGYFPQCQSVTPLRDPRGVCSKVGVLGKVLRYWLRKSVRSLKSSTRGIGCM